MQFFSFVFFVFVAIVCAAVYLCHRFAGTDKHRAQGIKWIYLVASYIFLTYADYRFSLILAALTVTVWLSSKRFTWLGILAAVAALAFFKYTNFFLDSFSRLFGLGEYSALQILLPLGISFYSFSAIGYLVDVRRGKLEARPLLDVAVYLSFFPKLTSGPIQSGKDLFAQLDAPAGIGWDSFSEGIQIFCIGLFKKMVLADRLCVFVDQVFATPLAFSGATALLAVLAYALQIYFDFSGYSDMAIGISTLVGIRLPKNFNLPYLSHNVTEFWKRWHITLSSWLQEYLYISLGGNRKGIARTYANLILTMVIGGIWHGPSWNFVLWGLLHGIALAVHKLWMQRTRSQEKPHKPAANIVCVLATFVFTAFCWIFFRADTTEKAFALLGQILCWRPGIWQPYFWLFVALGVLVICSLAAALRSGGTAPKKQNQSFVAGYYPLLDLRKFWQLVLFFVFCGLILGLAYTGGSPFIYGAF